MPLKGFSVPLSPEGRASLTPPPPWHYVGDILAVDFAAEPAAVAAVLPPGLEPDPQDPGGCVAFFIAWQYASEGGEEYLDPARSQYNELLLLVNGVYRGAGAAAGAAEGGVSWRLGPQSAPSAAPPPAPGQLAGRPVQTCPYIYVDKDTSMARGWIQGWPKKFGEVHTTRAFPLASKAGPPVEAGRAFRRHAGGQRAATGRGGGGTGEGLRRSRVSGQASGGQHALLPATRRGGAARPPVWELVRSIMSGVQRTEVWEGPATLDFFAGPRQRARRPAAGGGAPRLPVRHDHDHRGSRGAGDDRAG